MRTHRQKRSKSDASFDRNLGQKITLRRQMSEVISLREQVAQAELSVRRFDLATDHAADRTAPRGTPAN